MAYTSDASVGGLVRGALDDFRELIREEIALARSEMRLELGKATHAGAQFGVAGISLWFAAMFMLVAAALGVSAMFNWPVWAGFGLMAVLLAIAGMVFVSRGRKAISSVQALPRTVASIKENMR
jgi:hypothetical protein